jgi:hypothetical protein
MATVRVPNLATSFPRSGRDLLGGYAWLARLADKARAEAAGTGGDYVAYCPLSLGYLERVGVTQAEFEKLVADGASDDQLITYFDRHASSSQKRVSNSYVLEDMASHLDEQDAEEGRS